MVRQLRIGVILAAVLAIALAGCGGGTKPVPAAPSSAPTQAAPGSPAGKEAKDSAGPQFGGTLKAAMTAKPPDLDVMASTAAATRQAGTFFLEPLITYGEDYKIVPMLAQGWEVGDGGRQYTFRLRPGVKFHNGRDVSADDVLASFNRFRTVSPRKSEFEVVESATVQGSSAVVFRLKQPSGSFLAALASPISVLAIMPKEAIEGKAPGKLEVKDLIGTGPYQVADFKSDGTVVLKRFAGYKPVSGDATGLGGSKAAYLDEIQLIPVPKAEDRLAGLRKGEFDYAEALPTGSLTDLNADPRIATHIHKPEWWLIFEFNHGFEWAGKLPFRKAIQTGLDMEAVMKAVTNNTPDFYRLQPSIFFEEQAWWNDTAKEHYNQRNVAKAKEYLDQAGYKGEEIIWLTNQEYGFMYKGVTAAAEQLRKNLGMNIKVQVVDWAQQRKLETANRGWHISVTGISLRIDGSDFAPTFHSKAKRKFYANKEMDKWLDEGTQKIAFQERLDAYKQVQRVFYEDVPAIKVGDLFGLEAVSSKVKGFKSWYMPRFWNTWIAK